MLLNYFNLRDQPFGVTPDPRYLFFTKSHREALEGLLYGIHSGLGFIALTAEPGMGKTTLLRAALNRLGNAARTVFLFQSISSPTELFRALLIDLGEKDPPGTLIDLEMRLNEILLQHNESGQRVVVVLDEAQNLDDSVLEAIRMLSNFETSSHKLLQVVLCGQQQLTERLATRELMQLRQRISIFATLKPLTRQETGDYIKHRLKVAGYGNAIPLFTAEAVSLIAHYGDGIPRNINNLCFNSLSTACASGKKVIDGEVVREVIVDLGLEGSKFADPIDDLNWQEGTFAEPRVGEGFQEETFDEPSSETGLQGAAIGESTDDTGLREAAFAESNEDTGLQGEAFAESSDDLGWRAPRFAEEPTDELRWRTARFAEEPIDELDSQEEMFAELKGDLGWQGARFSRPLRNSEPDTDGDEESDLSEEKETSPGLRVALIATVLCASALAVMGWNVAHSGDPNLPLMSRVTSLFHSSAPVQDQSQVQAPSLPPVAAAPQPDPSAQTPRKRRDRYSGQASIGSGDNSSRTNDEKSGAPLLDTRITIPNSGVTAVRARQGQSVAGVCVERFNGCTPELLNTIVELNPGIKDQDHLEAGQRIFLPVIGSLPQSNN